MNTEMSTVRLLGAAQLLVIVGAVITERLLASVAGSGSISDMLVNISNNLTRMRISNLVALGQSLAIVVLGVLYYIVFYKEYNIIALVGLGLSLAAAITFAVSKIGANGLIPKTFPSSDGRSTVCRGPPRNLEKEDFECQVCGGNLLAPAPF
jgi:hypothetical protein